MAVLTQWLVVTGNSLTVTAGAHLTNYGALILDLPLVESANRAKHSKPQLSSPQTTA